MVNCTENIVGQGPSSVRYCRLELLIRLVLFQNGYFADVPLDQLLRGQKVEIMIYAETAEPFFREDNGFQMIAYFGWQVASVACFTNLEINYLQVIFRFPIQSLERDYLRVQLRIDCEVNDKYYGYDHVGDDGE